MKNVTKKHWEKAKGAFKKSRRLKLIKEIDETYHCPIRTCDNTHFKSIRGCRKHVYEKHGWYYYFDTKPDINEVLPQSAFKQTCVTKPMKSNTQNMPSFNIDCSFSLKFINWLRSTGGGSKNILQSEITSKKVLKYLKYCCADTSKDWDVPNNVVDYCIGSLKMINMFIEYLQDEWKVGFAGLIGYMNSLSNLLDFRRSFGICELNMSTMIATEIFLSRTKKSLAKSMRKQWYEILNVDYLNKIDCWASLEDLQLVIPFHAPKYKQIITNARKPSVCIPSHDISFATSFIVSVLFLLVKATRPMTFQFLTVSMIESVEKSGIIDQTHFKTQNKYGFDSLVFSKDVLEIVTKYVLLIRPRLNPKCDFVLINRNGTQLTKFSDVFGRVVFAAIGKYIHPTRYRQIIETESSKKLSVEEQFLISEDQKHTSNVAKIHYKKIRSQEVAEKSSKCMEKLVNKSISLEQIQNINKDSLTDNTLINFIINKTTETSTSKERTLKSSTRRKKTPFSESEDMFLKNGILKYGSGRWSAILSDGDFLFDQSRQAATLQVRAKLKGFI